MLDIEWGVAANRQADPMNRQRVAFSDQTQVMMEGAACHHVVFCMYFKEPDIRQGFQYILEVFGLEPQARTRRELGDTRRDERSS